MPIGSTFENVPELNVGAVFSVGAETANVINVAVQLIDRDNGNEVSERVALDFYLSSDANGDAISSAPGGGIAIGTDGLMSEFTNNVAGKVTSESDGDIDINFTETGTATFYLVLVMPDGQLYVSSAITFSAAIS